MISLCLGCTLKDKKGVAITNAFQKILDGSNRRQSQFEGRKPNKIWVDKDGEFYNNYFKKWLKDNDTEMYSTHNERRSVKRFIRTLKTKIYKYTTSISKNVYIDKLVDKGSEFYNNSFKKWLKDIDIDTYSIDDKRKSVIAERFIRTLENKIYKYMTAI